MRLSVTRELTYNVLHLKGGTSPINLEVRMRLFLLLSNAIALIFYNFHLFNRTCQVLCQLLFMMIVTIASLFEHFAHYTQCEVFYLH